ncbi:MAG: hypothetical protein M1821_000580 [Bathelium mastoideum]|nr:MAG: hypothetical protein M1821_000580 [Bathelium mastoideum]
MDPIIAKTKNVYTPDFLRSLRKSPLVFKPAGLPSIEQWMDTVSTTDSNQRRVKVPGARFDEPLLNSDKPTQRPSLMQTRSSNRVTSGSAGDTFLGPPKTAFVSASRIATKPADSPSNYTNAQDEDLAPAPKHDFQSRFFGDKNVDRHYEKGGLTNGRKFGREDGDGLANVRNRKGSGGQEDLERTNRRDWNHETPLGRGERDRQGNDGERRPGRVGIGRGRHESGSWRTPPASAGLNVEWEMPHRSAVNERDRRGNRDFRAEQEPEWMDEAAPNFESAAKIDNKPKTAEDFQRWKDQMRGIKTETEKKPDGRNDTPTSVKDSNDASKPATPLVVDEGLGKLSGWGATKATEVKGDGTKPFSGQPKASRFKSFFGPKETPPLIQADSQPESIGSPMENGKDADKEGFNLILKKLAAQNVQSPRPEESNVPSNPLGALFGNMNESKNRAQEIHALPNEQPDPHRSDFGPWSPSNQQQQGLGQAPTPRTEQALRTPQSEAFFKDLHTVSDSRNQPLERQPDTKKRDLLLSLMKNQPVTAAQPPPRPRSHQLPDDPDFQIFLNNETPQQPAPKSSRGPPSGFFDERFANDFDRQQQQQQPQPAPMEYEQEMLGRRPSHPQRGPNNFFDDPAFSHFQRGNPMPEAEQRFQGNPVGGPGPNLPMFDGPFQPGATMAPPQHLQQQQHSSQAPPPQQRHDVGPPPGFHIPPFRNPQQQPPPLSAGFPPGFNSNQANYGLNRNMPPMDGHPGLNRQMSLPPGGGGPSGPPPHMFPGGPPSGAPPGFFNNGPPNAPPPGFPGMPSGPQGFGPDGLVLGRGGGLHGGVGGGQQGSGRGQAYGMDSRMFR